MLYYWPFYTIYSEWNVLWNCKWLDLNQGPLMSELTALLTVSLPQPMIILINNCWSQIVNGNRNHDFASEFYFNWSFKLVYLCHFLTLVHSITERPFCQRIRTQFSWLRGKLDDHLTYPSTPKGYLLLHMILYSSETRPICLDFTVIMPIIAPSDKLKISTLIRMRCFPEWRPC